MHPSPKGRVGERSSPGWGLHMKAPHPLLASRGAALPFGEGCSCEHPVQEPGRRRDCAVEPRAEQPEPAAGFILDAEIIAGAAAVLGPPGAFDALRAFGGDDFVERAPPAEP